MMEHIMPDIPRIYTAVAEWMACMLFILPVKKRFSKMADRQCIMAADAC